MPTEKTQRAAVPIKGQSIPEFCKSYGFSRATYYNLPPEERPDEMEVLGRIIITTEASAKWARKRTTASKRAARRKAQNTSAR